MSVSSVAAAFHACCNCDHNSSWLYQWSLIACQFLPFLSPICLVIIAYTFLLTPCSAQLAYNVDHDSYALIFGFNTFIALLLQTFLTLAVSDEHGLNLDIRIQVSYMHNGCSLLLPPLCPHSQALIGNMSSFVSSPLAQCCFLVIPA